MSACGYHHNHLVFERQQSLELREREWEDRIKPLTSWSVLLMRGAGAFILFAAMAIIAA
jgi:hypothetical protein